MNFWIAQAIAVVICVLSVFSYFKKTKAKFLYVQVITNILYCIEYVFLGVLAGVVGNFITTVKYVSFRRDAKLGRKTTIKKSVIYCILSVLLGLIAIDGWFTYIPIVNAVILTFATAQDNPIVLRASYTVSNVMWIIFNFMSRAYVSAMYSFVELIVSFVSIFIFLKASKERRNEVIVLAKDETTETSKE